MLSSYLDGTAQLSDIQGRFSGILDYAVKTRSPMRILFSPTLSSSLSAGIIVSFLEAGGLRTISTPTPFMDGDHVVEEPTIIIDVPILEKPKIQAPLLYLGSTPSRNIPRESSVVVEEMSIATLLSRIPPFKDLVMDNVKLPQETYSEKVRSLLKVEQVDWEKI